MNERRKMMIESGKNLSWCKPYTTENGRVSFAICEGKICGLRIDGLDHPAESDIPMAARIANSDYDLYDGWSATHVLIDCSKELGCCECPWFDTCEAMDDSL